MKLSRLFLSAMAAVMASASMWAGTPFNGIITDPTFKPIKGAKVYVSNPKNYTKSDRHGRFGLTDVGVNDTLHIIIKMEKYVIPVDSARSMRIVISDQKVQQAKEDPELVNMGYGFVSRREYNSPSNGISGDRLRATGRSDIMDALVGLVPNLERHPNGTVTIRGVNSFTGYVEPLYVIDGVIVPDLNGININDVESVEVLKDASIYGSRGAGGAILVTTRRGRK